MVSIQVLATPIRGLVRSSLVKPIALNIERDPARSRPSVIKRLRCFRSIGVKDYDSAGESESMRRHGCECGDSRSLFKALGVIYSRDTVIGAIIYAAFFSPGAFASGWPRLAAACSICAFISPPIRNANPVMYSHISRIMAAPREPYVLL